MQIAILSPFKHPFYSTTAIQKPIELSDSSFSLTDQIRSIVYEYPNSDQTTLESFLRDNLSVVNYISEAKMQINKYFGDDTKLNIEVVFDPEVEEDEGVLFMKIETSEDLNSAMRKLEVLDREWLVPIVGKDIVKFNIDLDFD